jgi:carboxyl-terminal processing protease
MDDIYDRFQHGEMQNADSIHFTNQKAFKTKGGKTVYGGGGIMPDEFVSIDTSIFIHSVTRLYLDGRFNNFVYQYYTQRLPEWQQYKSPADFAARYQNSEDAWNQLVAFAEKDSINLKKIPAEDKKAIQGQIKAFLARFRWRTQGYYEVANTNDKVIAKALEVIRK